MTRALLQQALDCLQAVPYKTAERESCIDTIRAELAKPERQPMTLDEAMKHPLALAAAYSNGWDAALAQSPAWKDAPNAPGDWVCRHDITDHLTAYDVTDELRFKRNLALKGRWFGPIPSEDVK